MIVFPLSYAKYDLPKPDENGFTYELQPIDKADRNALGNMVMELITLKCKISGTWSRLKAADAENLMALLRNNRTGELRFYDVSTKSTRTIMAYYGAGAKANYQRYNPDASRRFYSSISANFIEM